MTNREIERFTRFTTSFMDLLDNKNFYHSSGLKVGEYSDGYIGG